MRKNNKNALLVRNNICRNVFIHKCKNDDECKMTMFSK